MIRREQKKAEARRDNMMEKVAAQKRDTSKRRGGVMLRGMVSGVSSYQITELDDTIWCNVALSHIFHLIKTHEIIGSSKSGSFHCQCWSTGKFSARE